MRELKSHAGNSMKGWLTDLLLLSAIFGIPFLQFLGKLPLIDPDEGRYAEIPREMLEKGDLITPFLNYVKYFEKPPLLYWLNAASLELFGQTEFAARLPSALCGLLTVLATYLVARQLYDRRSALISAFILGTSTGFVLQSRIILTDVLLTFCLTAALGAFIVAAQREERRGNWLAWHTFYLFCGLAVLSKGLIGIVFPGAIIFIYLLLTGNWRILARMRLFTGLLLFLAITAPWFVAVSLENPEFPHFFFIREHFERFTSTVHGRYQPVWFFLPVLLGTMLPWSFFIPGAMARAWRGRRHEQGQSGLYLLIWIAVIFLFFSKSSSKLVPYILPIFPPLAMLIAHRIGQLREGRGQELKISAIMLGTTLTLLGLAGLGYAYLSRTLALLTEIMPRFEANFRQLATNAPPLSTTVCVVIGAVFLLQGVGVLATGGRKPMQMLVVLCLCSFTLEMLAPHFIMGPIAQAESPRDLALKARSLATPDTHIVTFGPMQAVSWYTGRRVLVAGWAGELEFGSRQGNQSAWFPDMATVSKIWNSNQHLLIFLKKHEFENLLPELHTPPSILGQSGRYLLIGNR